MKKNKILLCSEVCLILLICSFPIFYRLDALAIRQWDEARNAVSALEMFQNKNYIVRYFNGQPDFFDVKPPLLIWLQVFFVRIIGPEVLAIRLTAAIAAFLTAAFLIFYFSYYFKDKLTGYLAALILVTAEGYVGSHVARTGEHDVLLVLFTTVILFIYYKYLTQPEPGNQKLILIAILFVAGVLTKSVAILMIVPGMFVMTFVHGAWGRLLRNKFFYLGAGGFIVSCATYYILRENMQPGYLKEVWAGELIPRYVNSNNNFYEEESGFYYIRNLMDSRFTYWLFLLVPAMLIFSWKGFKDNTSFTFYLTINSLVYLLIISAGTYNYWYDAPLYPMFAAIIALFASQTACLKLPMALKGMKGKYAVGLLIISMLVYPGLEIMKKVSRTEEFYWDEEIYSMCYVLKDNGISEIPDGESFSVVFEGYNGHLLFYTKRAAMLYGDTIPLKSPDEIVPGEYVMTSQEDMANRIISEWNAELILQDNRIKVLKTGSKSEP